MKRFLLVACIAAIMIACLTLSGTQRAEAAPSIFPDSLRFDFRTTWFSTRKDFTAACVMAAALSGSAFSHTPRQVTDWCGDAAQNVHLMFWPDPKPDTTK